MQRKWLAILVALLLALAGSCGAAALSAQEEPLDRRLLKDLDDDLLQGLPNPDVGKPPKRPGEQAEAGNDALPPADNPLEQISRRMRAAQQRLGEQQLSLETRELQREIVGDLDKLIQRARKQQGAGKKSGGQGSGSAQGGAEGGNPRPGPASNSSDRIEKGAAEDAEMADVRDVLRRHWGHLPEKLREELQNSLGEQFLPKYEKLIEAYYRRLAEQRRARP